MDPNTSRRNTTALSSTSLIFSGSVRISTGLPCFGAFSRVSFGWRSFGALGCFSRAGFALPWESLAGLSFGAAAFKGASSDVFSACTDSVFTGFFSFTGAAFGADSFFTFGVKGLSNFFSSLIASSFTDSTSSSISCISETGSILRTLITAGLLPIPKNPELPSLIT